jgi:hypothetical protein
MVLAGSNLVTTEGVLCHLLKPYSSIPLWNVSRSNFTPSRPEGARLERVAFQNCTLRG